ncbi:unnamed protein product [Bubo scandiacus]
MRFPILHTQFLYCIIKAYWPVGHAGLGRSTPGVVFLSRHAGTGSPFALLPVAMASCFEAGSVWR